MGFHVVDSSYNQRLHGIIVYRNLQDIAPTVYSTVIFSFRAASSLLRISLKKSLPPLARRESSSTAARRFLERRAAASTSSRALEKQRRCSCEQRSRSVLRSTGEFEGFDLKALKRFGRGLGEEQVVSY